MTTTEETRVPPSASQGATVVLVTAASASQGAVVVRVAGARASQGATRRTAARA
jgi:hypothetical protein